MQEDPPFNITSIHEKWRFTCLADDRYDADEGHTNWFPINGTFRCRSCAKAAETNPGVDPEYGALRDKTTGEVVPREDITLAIGSDRQASRA